jgi:hypothetical protein
LAESKAAAAVAAAAAEEWQSAKAAAAVAAPTDHTCHFIRVMMPRDVRQNKDPRMQLLQQLFTDAMAQRLAGLSL